MTDHHLGLLAGYLAAVAVWWLLFSLRSRTPLIPRVWNGPAKPAFRRPWVEVGVALIGLAGVLLVGQLWMRGWMLPESGSLAPLLASLNQVLIFAPVLLVPLIRRQGPETMLLPGDRVVSRLIVGVVLALCALGAYSLVREGSSRPWTMVANIMHVDHIDIGVQVLAEDIAIGILLVRLAAAVSATWTVVIVAALFALGHVPAMVARGATPGEFGGLAGDVVLGCVVLGTVLRSGDIVWFWPVHTVMDLTQFSRVSGVG